MERALSAPAAADAAAVTEVVAALESSLYGQSAFSQADLEDEWSDLDLEQNAHVVRDSDRIVGYGVVRERGELWRAEGYVHPDARGRGIGKLIATALEEHAARRGAGRIQNGVFEADAAAADEIVAGTICTGDTYGGGFVHALFTRRPWRRQGVGAALLGDSFGRFWERGEYNAGLSVDAASDSVAFRLYERAGMAPALGWVMYEKQLGVSCDPSTG